MNLLLPLGALGAYFILKPKPSTKSSEKTTVAKLCFSDDCLWICSGNKAGSIAGFDFSKELYSNKKLFAKHIAKHLNEPDFGIQSLTKELMKTWKWGKCKPAKDNISIDDPLTLRYVYANTLPTAAFYLALSEKITDYQLAIWLGTEYPKILLNLGLLTSGNYKEAELVPRFDSITPEILSSELAKLFILVPEFRRIQAELIAQILLIQFSQLMEIEKKDKCYRMIAMEYGDFSSLSNQIYPMYQKMFNKIFDAVILANPK